MISGSPPGGSAADVLGAIRTGGLMPLFTSSDPDELFRVAEAIVESGISVMEVTLRAPGVVEAMAELIARVEAAGLPLTVGAGTVLDTAATDAVIEAGARFVVSPITAPDVAERCRAEGMVWIPGCATPTEIHTAMALGCSAVKLFPADTIGGPGFLRSIRSVFPAVEAIPSGGIGPDPGVIGAWFRAGAIAVAMGSRLFPPEVIAGQDWSRVRRRLEQAVAAVEEARRGLEV